MTLQQKINDRDNFRQKTSHAAGFHRGVFYSSSAATVTIITLFLETMVAVRILETDCYGIYVLLLAMVNFSTMIIDLGVRTASTQLIASSKPERQFALVNSIVLFRLLTAGGASILLLASAHFLRYLNPSTTIIDYIIYIPAMMSLMSLDELFAGMLQGFHLYGHMAFAQTVRNTLRFLLSIFFLAVVKLGVLSLIYSWIISYSVAVIYQYLYIPTEKRLKIQQNLIKEVLHFGFPLQVSRFLYFVSGRIDILLLGSLAGVNSVALYDVATKIPVALSHFFNSYITVFFPKMSTLLAEEKKEKANRLLEHSLRLSAFGLAFLALVAVLFGEEIITLMFSAKYTDSGFAFGLFMIALLVESTLHLMGYTLTSAGYPGRSLVENIARAVITTIANLLLIPFMGFLGSAWAKLLANCTSNPLLVWLLKKSNLRISATTYIRSTAVLLMFALIFWLFHPHLLIIKSVFLLLFIIANFVLSSISTRDLLLLFPKTKSKKLKLFPQK